MLLGGDVNDVANISLSEKFEISSTFVTPFDMMSLYCRDPFIEEFFGPSQGTSLALHNAPTHAHLHYFYETEEAVTLTVDVPGVTAKDLQVQIEDNVVRVSGERKTAGNESKFIRSFSIDPQIVDVENINANLDCGVLTLTAPKLNKPTVTKTITVTEAPMAVTQPKVTKKRRKLWPFATPWLKST